MAILVTGGCGFIGSHLSEELLSRGCEVRVLGLRCGQENIRTFQDEVSFSRVDVRDYEKVTNAVDDEIEVIFHLASLVNVDESREMPLEFLTTNVTGTVNLLERARIKGIKKFIYMSTCEVYGNIPTGRATESHPTDPRSPYAASKFAAERYLLSYAHTYPEGPTINIVRGFNQFGPRQNSGPDGAVIAKFARSLVNGESLSIFGKGEQTRDYVFVEDTVDALVRVLEAELPTGDVTNVATGKERSVHEIAVSMCELENADPERRIRFAADRPGEILRSCGDWSKAAEILGWKPSTSFKEGLSKTLTWFDGALSPS